MDHFFRPVIALYFAVATPLFGGSPVLFHAANVALHLATGLVLLYIAERISGSALYAWSAALFFLVQPAGIEAVAWVGALAETIGALFGCLAILGLLRWRDTGHAGWRILSCGAFLVALLTHESSVVFLPVIVFADWAFCRPDRGDLRTRAVAWLRAYAPFLVVLAAYLAVDLTINSRNHLVREGHYTIGRHVVWNVLEYLVALWVGRHDLVNYLLLGVSVAALLARGNRRARFATVWMLLALSPFLGFAGSQSSRYMYQPAIGVSLLMAEAVLFVDRQVRARAGRTLRVAAVAVVIGALALRSAAFAAHNIEAFAARTEVYRSQGAFLAIQCEGRGAGTVPANGRLEAGATRVPLVPAPERSEGGPTRTPLTASPEMQRSVPYRFGLALAQWTCRDPAIEVLPY